MIDFATSESPYRDANKGWVNDDIYIQWGAKPESRAQSGVEFANVSVFWQPINQLAILLLTVVLLATVFVFFSVSISHGNFQTPVIANKVVVEDAAPIDRNVVVEKALPNNVVISEVVPALEKNVEPKGSQTSSEFAAAALGGQPMKK